MAGVGPSAVQLGRLGQIAGFDVVLYSPDRPTLDAMLPLSVRTVPLSASGGVPPLQADSRSAIVLMFHDHEWEREFLPAALATQAFYIGAMGSRATHRLRMRQLREKGFGTRESDRVRGPAGLFAGTKRSVDIALSVLAEIMQSGPDDDRLERHPAQAAPAPPADLGCRVS